MDARICALHQRCIATGVSVNTTREAVLQLASQAPSGSGAAVVRGREGGLSNQAVGSRMQHQCWAAAGVCLLPVHAAAARCAQHAAGTGTLEFQRCSRRIADPACMVCGVWHGPSLSAGMVGTNAQVNEGPFWMQHGYVASVGVGVGVGLLA